MPGPARGDRRHAARSSATTRLRADLDRLDRSGGLDLVVNPAEVGARTPDPAIFRAAPTLAGVQPSETLYVDDAADHLAATERLGIRAHLFRGGGGLGRELARRGVLTGAAGTPD